MLASLSTGLHLLNEVEADKSEDAEQKLMSTE